MQIVVAKHAHRAITEITHEAQCRERGRAAVDEVAHEPQAIFRTIEPECAKQRLQFFETALNIADRVGSHSSRQDRASNRCNRMAPLNLLLRQSWLRSFPNRS